MDWPADRLSVQVLDDSTDADTRALVDRRLRRRAGVDRRRLPRAAPRRSPRLQGRRAGGRAAARPTPSSSRSSTPTSCRRPTTCGGRSRTSTAPTASPTHGLALVQAQWGHLNADESALTRAQSLWVDDHHTLQMSWRSAMWQFVNFTGTAGVWRASRGRGRRRLARGEPRRGLRAELPAPVRRLPDEVRQGDRRARRAAGDLHRLQGAAEALDPGLGAAAAAAPAHAAVRLPVLAGPAPRVRVPHVHLVAVAGCGRCGSRCCRC